MNKPYRVTFSILAYIDDSMDFAAFQTERIGDIRNAREISMKLKHGGGFQSVYIEQEDADGNWTLLPEEYEVNDGKK